MFSACFVFKSKQLMTLVKGHWQNDRSWVTGTCCVVMSHSDEATASLSQINTGT